MGLQDGRWTEANPGALPDCHPLIAAFAFDHFLETVLFIQGISSRDDRADLCRANLLVAFSVMVMRIKAAREKEALDYAYKFVG